MIVDLQKSLNGLLLLLTVCLGLLSGLLVADWLGIYLAPTDLEPAAVKTEPTRAKTYRLEDFKVIAQRNLFDSNAPPAAQDEMAPAVQQEAPGTPPQAIQTNLKLLGTVAGGPDPLAIIQAGKDTDVYRIGDSLPGNLNLAKVERDRVIVQSGGGEETVLALVVETGPEKKAARTRPRTAPVSTSNIVEIGENRWEIPREEADRARSNLNALLKTARMVPKIENGETVGFTIVNIQSGTFLDLLGLKVGDVLVQINEVELNSPEKALQIFQQVREANNLTLGLLRNGSRQTFEYTID
ncbi:MAG: type II secretion system protein GspC [Desulfuromonadales bacterium]|nr:type II secretion system protein GspC [Desulfuromonadales bacterium]